MKNPLGKLWSAVGKAIHEFDLINEGDRIAIGLSGGKDSILLTYALARFKRIAPVDFGLVALTIDGGFTEDDPSADGLTEFCGSLGIEHIRLPVPIKEAVVNGGQEENPCSLCSKLRRGALHSLALSKGCGKVALAHHADDAVETVMMNLFFGGRFGCFRPKTYLDETGITVVRPMVYVRERDIRRYVGELRLPVVNNPCPANGRTKRQEIKELLASFEACNPGSVERVLASLKNPGQGWNWR